MKSIKDEKIVPKNIIALGLKPATKKPSQKKERGTDIILHINDDSKEFLEEGKVEEILKKYCKFLPVKIKFVQK